MFSLPGDSSTVFSGFKIRDRESVTFRIRPRVGVVGAERVVFLFFLDDGVKVSSMLQATRGVFCL